MEATKAGTRADGLAVAALAISCLSLFVPVVGTLVAVLTVWFASRSGHDSESRRLVRAAALITVAVAVVVIHLTAALFLLPTSVEMVPSEPVRTSG